MTDRVEIYAQDLRRRLLGGYHVSSHELKAIDKAVRAYHLEERDSHALWLRWNGMFFGDVAKTKGITIHQARGGAYRAAHQLDNILAAAGWGDVGNNWDGRIRTEGEAWTKI